MATTNLPTVAGLPQPTKPSTSDPLNVNARLYKQVSDLLNQLDGDDSVTIRERIAALTAIGRLQTIFAALRKENTDDFTAGSSVKKYAKAFKTNGSGRRAQLTRPTPALTSALNDGDDSEDDLAL